MAQYRNVGPETVVDYITGKVVEPDAVVEIPEGNSCNGEDMYRLRGRRPGGREDCKTCRRVRARCGRLRQRAIRGLLSSSFIPRCCFFRHRGTHARTPSCPCTILGTNSRGSATVCAAVRCASPTSDQRRRAQRISIGVANACWPQKCECTMGCRVYSLKARK